jgi:ribose transport system permease protein
MASDAMVTAPQDTETPQVTADEATPSVRFLEKYGSLWTVVVLAAVVIVFGILSPALFTQAGWGAVSKATYEYLPLAIGETFVIITGGIDLSVGAILGFSCVVAGYAMEHLLGNATGSMFVTVVGFAVGIAVGAACGVVNGIAITKLRLPPFIVTLATLYALGGATYIVSEEPIYQIPHQLVTFGQQELLGGWFIAPVLVALACIVVFGIFLSRSSFGLRTYAIGSNPITAERAGINVSRHLIWVYTLSGALAGIAGILVTSNFAQASPLFGNNDELPAIAAVVIGGASLFGGRGNLLGTLCGTFLIAVLTVGLVLVQVTSFWQEVAIGGAIVLAVTVDQFLRKMSQR